ncbi:hypothetical protein F2Q68_00005202 [Brassica cretica]|uniref:Uncharacterized protein n=1 Tax=Brassica cretica TaxID=69181 RepID=A0A8S9JB49_BRACR|nr:hypothetical protein F2Q68_00005202 [Brassica cretica]
MQVDEVIEGRVLRKRKEKIPKHLKREANEKEMDGFTKRVLRIPVEKHFDDVYYTHRLSAESKMSRLWCLDIDQWYWCTSIDINLHLSRHLLISIVSTDAHRSIVLPLVDLYVVSSGEMSFKLQNAPKS